MYIYDAWNRLVKVRASNDAAVTIQTAEFDATGRRIKKVVTNSGGFDDVVVYLYDGQKICETRNGSGNMVQQFIHGTQYIDELVMVRVKGKGDLYVHQDANWNVIGLTDLAGSVVEAYTLSPYGELTVDQETGYGDRDADGDVDATDKGTPGTDCTGTVTGACRVLDLDFDGDYDIDDANAFDSLPQGSMLHPGRMATNVDQPFGHQGLLHEPEIGMIHNRAREYDAVKRRFVQRDPLTRRPTAGSGYQDGLNLYQYVGSNPLSKTDPSGRVIPILAACGCLLYMIACELDVDTRIRSCIAGCHSKFPLTDKILRASFPACRDCCRETGKGDILNCVITCGGNGPDNDYGECFGVSQ